MPGYIRSMNDKTTPKRWDLEKESTSVTPFGGPAVQGITISQHKVKVDQPYEARRQALRRRMRDTM